MLCLLDHNRLFSNTWKLDIPNIWTSWQLDLGALLALGSGLLSLNVLNLRSFSNSIMQQLWQWEWRKIRRYCTFPLISFYFYFFAKRRLYYITTNFLTLSNWLHDASFLLIFGIERQLSFDLQSANELLKSMIF